MHRAAGDFTAAAHAERQPGAVDLDTESAQRLEQRGDRPGPGLLIAVELDDGGAQRGQRRHEPQHRSGQAAVDTGRGAGVQRPADGQLRSLAVDP